jgi:hypothetical protein
VDDRIVEKIDAKGVIVQAVEHRRPFLDESSEDTKKPQADSGATNGKGRAVDNLDCQPGSISSVKP